MLLGAKTESREFEPIVFSLYRIHRYRPISRKAEGMGVSDIDLEQRLKAMRET